MTAKNGYSDTELSNLLPGSMINHLRVERSPTLEDAQKSPDSNSSTAPPPAKVFFRGEKPLDWNVENSFELRADGLVFDHTLGTTGIIHYIDDQEQEEIQLLLENAAYVRHLKEQLQAAGTRPPMIEVVLVIKNWGDSVHTVADALRNISETSTLLHTIGVSLLAAQHHEDSASLRRAFPWLLSATYEWYENRDSSSRDPKHIEHLFTKNYRVQGERHWDFDSDHRLHLVHGPNGSGKSSLVESFELILTGKIERIERIEGESGDYPDILTHHTPQGDRVEPLELKAKFSDKPEDDIVQDINDEGLSNPLSPEMSAGGFRLNQQLSNQLIFAESSSRRAAVFLKNFFPEDQHALQSYQRAQDREQTAWDSFPDWVRGEFQDSNQLCENWQIGGGLTQFLPREIRTEENGVLLDIFFDQLSSKKEVSEDEIWKDSFRRASRHLPALTTAHSALERLENWRPDTKKSSASRKLPSGNRPEVFNQWLHQTALIDLLEKELDVTATLALLKKQEDGQPEKGIFAGIRERTDARKEKLEAALQEARDLKEELTQKLSAFEGESLHGSSTKDVHLSEEDVEALNEIGSIMGLESESGTPLGNLVLNVTEKHSEEALRDPGWDTKPDSKAGKISFIKSPHEFSSLKARVERLENLTRDLGRHQHELTSMPPSELREKLVEMHEAHSDLNQHDAKIVHVFSDRVSDELNAATNELMALMTPARWAYQNIKMEAGTTRDGQTLAVQSGEMTASAKLNTAELNTMALALFLLSAIGREENPLATVILDDPFENMDELTTVNVARSFGRLIQLWEHLPALEKWRMIIFLHGAENVERVRDEVPCAAYFLPWLTPGGSNPNNEIHVHKSRLKS